MRAIDEVYLERPYYGSPRMTHRLQELKWEVNEKRVARLMRVMGLQAVVPSPHTSRRHPQHKVYPYLLRGRKILAPDEAWCADIAYIPMPYGYLHLAAVTDRFSRYVLSRELSNSLDTAFCLEALTRALTVATPGIFNTDQGTQFTSDEFTGRLLSSGIQISMDGRGRAMDNVFVERLWRSVKYEEVYISDYADGAQARSGLSRYFRYDNQERTHVAGLAQARGGVFRCAHTASTPRASTLMKDPFYRKTGRSRTSRRAEIARPGATVRNRITSTTRVSLQRLRFASASPAGHACGYSHPYSQMLAGTIRSVGVSGARFRT
jgi:putative transposase